MNTLILLFIIVPILVLILLALNLLFSPKIPDPEKLSTFECGFSAIINQTRLPFFISFFKICLLFLILDLEILIMVPVTVSLGEIAEIGFLYFLIFFIILTIGFAYEISANVINFVNNSKN